MLPSVSKEVILEDNKIIFQYRIVDCFRKLEDKLESKTRNEYLLDEWWICHRKQRDSVSNNASCSVHSYSINWSLWISNCICLPCKYDLEENLRKICWRTLTIFSGKIVRYTLRWMYVLVQCMQQSIHLCRYCKSTSVDDLNCLEQS